MYSKKYFNYIYGNTWRQRRVDAPVRAANDAGINDSEAKQQYAAIYYALRQQDHIFEQKKGKYLKKKIFKMQARDWDTCRNIENALFHCCLKGGE